MQVPIESSGDWFPEVASEAARVAQLAEPPGVLKQGYYGLPLLKEPTWRWEIAWYFFLEAIAAGAYLISSIAELTRGRKLAKLSRTGFYISTGALAPCPALLIADLGEPKRFHHMLRVLKPVSPMNLGSWTLAGFGTVLSALALKQLFEGGKGFAGKAVALLPRRAMILLGIPAAFMLSCYTGVLISTTSNPLWCRSRFLGVLFACTAFSNGASALTIATELIGNDRTGSRALRRLHPWLTAAEGVALAAYAVESGKAAAPLLKGRYSALFYAGTAALMAPLILRKIARRRSRTRLLPAACALAGGLALKWAIVYAGRTSAIQNDSARISKIPGRP